MEPDLTKVIGAARHAYHRARSGTLGRDEPSAGEILDAWLHAQGDLRGVVRRWGLPRVLAPDEPRHSQHVRIWHHLASREVIPLPSDEVADGRVGKSRMTGRRTDRRRKIGRSFFVR